MKEYEILFPLDNEMFMNVISNSFRAFVECGTSRSTDKLKPLHGSIAKELMNRLSQHSKILRHKLTIKSQGFGDGTEASMPGRYMGKKVDITVIYDGKPVAGIGVKFVMQNYSQNSVNYFENMLGETANIRSARLPYFQIFIIPDKMPYYSKSGDIKHWETFTENNAEKYLNLSGDDTREFFHTPDNTLICVIGMPIKESLINDKDEYLDYYKRNDVKLVYNTTAFQTKGSAVLVNDFSRFMDKVVYLILSKIV